MGLYDRDYYRVEPRGFRDWVPGRSVVALIVVMIGLFVLQLLLTGANAANANEMLRYGRFELGAFLEGEVWRFITAPFLYESYLQLLFGMLILYFFGRGLEDDLGGQEFLCFYLASTFFAQMVELIVRVSLDDRITATCGAAGPITAVLLLYAIRHPREIAYFFFIPVPMWALAALAILLSLVRFTDRGTSLALAGAFFAYAYYAFNVRITAYWSHTRIPNRRLPKLRVLPMEEDDNDTEPVAVIPSRHESTFDEQLEAKVDYVLEKVAREGRDSLSTEENDILLKASEVYRKRRSE